MGIYQGALSILAQYRIGPHSPTVSMLHNAHDNGCGKGRPQVIMIRGKGELEVADYTAFVANVAKPTFTRDPGAESVTLVQVWPSLRKCGRLCAGIYAGLICA